MSEKLGLVGRKIGMTRIFTEDGESIPVTVLEVAGNRVTQVKTEERQPCHASEDGRNRRIQCHSSCIRL